MSTIKADNIATLAGVSTSMANAVNGSAKAWVNFNGTGTVAIRRAFNVSSITDLATGQYRVTFSNAMVDENYTASILPGGANTTYFLYTHYTENPTAGGFRFLTNNANNTAQLDAPYLYVAIFS